MITIYFTLLLVFLGTEIIGQETQQMQFPAIRNDSNFISQLPPTAITNPTHGSIGKIAANSIQGLTLDLSYVQGLKSNGNKIFSPLSIGVLLSLLMLGTDGQTSIELNNLLHLSDNKDAIIHESYQSLIKNLKSSIPGVKIKMTNQLFLKKGFPLFLEFIDQAKLFYETGLQGVDFESNPYGVVRDINDYISQATEGKITDLIKDPFPPSAVFVAVNTILFNGLWKDPFIKIFTYNGTFFTGTSTIDMPMMVNDGPTVRFLSGYEVGFDMIAIPYKDDRFSMYILTPNGGNSLQNIEESLDSIIINSLIKRMTWQKIVYTIPRMQIKKSIKLKDDLKILGLHTLFNTAANFKKMTTFPDVFVEEIIHEALLEITETGTVAAAASAGSADRIFVKSFIFDKPSILFVRDDTNGAILFWANVVQPTPIYT